MNTAEATYSAAALSSRPSEKPIQNPTDTAFPNGQVPSAERLQRSPTGIDGLDVMIGGGLPKGRVALISGGPGTGKTTMSLQFLVNGCLRFGENGIFISLD